MNTKKQAPKCVEAPKKRVGKKEYFLFGFLLAKNMFDRFSNQRARFHAALPVFSKIVM